MMDRESRTWLLIAFIAAVFFTALLGAWVHAKEQQAIAQQPVPLFKRDGMIYFQYQGEVWACVRTGETSVGCVDPNNLEYACRYLDETAGFFDNCVKAMSIRYNGKTFPKGSTA